MTGRDRFKLKFAHRAGGLVQSDIRRMTRECDRMGGINLGQGICDQPAAQPIKDAAIDAIRADRSTYSRFEGIDELRRLIAGKMHSYNGIRCDPETELIITVGATGGFTLACMALVDPGDEAILFSPFYSYHLNLLRLCGAKVRFVRMRPPGWEYDRAELESAFSDRTKLIVVNTPSNPSGKVYSRDELEGIARLCQKWGCVAVTDEIYEYILYDGRRHVSLGALAGMEDRTVTLSGLSKTYNMTGWRLGYAVTRPDLASRMGMLNDLLYVCAPTPLQHGATAAYRLPDSYYSEMSAAYAGKLDALSRACETAGLGVIRPQGAYYMLADITRLGVASDLEASRLLLSEAGVSSVPGSSFYSDPADGRTQVRFCFAKKDGDLEQACRRIESLAGRSPGSREVPRDT